MTKRQASVGAAALLTALVLASAAAAGGAPAPAGGPNGAPCHPPKKCTIVKGKQVCTTPKPIPSCGGG